MRTIEYFSKLFWPSMFVLFCQPALAFNYHELEVYPWQTEGPGVWEFESFLLASNGQSSKFGTETLRNSLEVNTGIYDWLEVAAYSDFTRLPDSSWKQTATRLRTHMSFYEKGELPVDLGAYFEFAKPTDGIVKWELEAKLIVEKDLGRFTFTANPIIELENEEESKVKADGTTEKETANEIEKSYALAASYRISENFLPKLSFFDEIKEQDSRVSILYPSIDYRVSSHFKVGLGLGFGLSSASEKRLVNSKLEFEF